MILKSGGLRMVWERIQSNHLKKAQWVIREHREITKWNQDVNALSSQIYGGDARMVQYI